MKEHFRIALKNIRKKRLRSLLTILGIVISITIIFTLISISLGLENAVKEQFRQFGTDKFFIEPRGQLAGHGTGAAAQLTEDDIKTIESVFGVKELSYWTAGNAKIEFNNEIRYVIVMGIPLKKSDVFIETGFYKAEDGSLLKEGDERKIMIGNQYKQTFFKKSVKVGDKIKINEKELKVKSILKTIGNPQDDKLIFMPLKDFKSLFPQTKDRIDQIAVQVYDEGKLKEVALNVERKLLKARHITEKTRDFRILTPEEILATFSVVLNIITAFLLGVAAISILVGSIGITNTMFTSVLERTKEIGVMKAIGAKNNDILKIFLFESGFLGVIGGIIGIVLGIIISKAIENIAITQLGTTLLQAATPIYLILGCLAFSFIIGLVSGFWPAYRAIKVKPVEALRYE